MLEVIERSKVFEGERGVEDACVLLEKQTDGPSYRHRQYATHLEVYPKGRSSHKTWGHYDMNYESAKLDFDYRVDLLRKGLA